MYLMIDGLVADVCFFAAPCRAHLQLFLELLVFVLLAMLLRRWLLVHTFDRAEHGCDAVGCLESGLT